VSTRVRIFPPIYRLRKMRSPDLSDLKIKGAVHSG
jgi:hypothetical protein